MHVESEILISRPPAEVFDYLARAERLPEYVADFASVKQASDGEPGLGTQYSYEMVRGQTEGTFEWTEFEPGPAFAGGPCQARRAWGSNSVHSKVPSV